MRQNYAPTTAPRRLLTASLCCAAACLTASAQTPIVPGDITIRLETVATGLVAPVAVVDANDGTDRLFIVDQAGQIHILESGVLLPTPFLDVTDRMVTVNPGFDERGLLGLAFHPDYASNGRFFVRYSAPRAGAAGEPCFGTSRGCHSERLSEFRVSAANPNVADAMSEIILLDVDEPQFNHNGGDVAFGPDGYLYLGLGDGGGAHDGLADNPPSHGPIGNGQNIETLLGSMLRIDVDSGSPYAIPATNPFANATGADEIYAYGFRNPFRFSFDDGPGGTNALYVADVGQALFEELSIVTLGGNYGWVIREGFQCFDPFDPSNPPASCADTGPLGEPLLDPIIAYTHADGGLSIIGGFVYRGTMNPALNEIYVFGDFSGAFASAEGRLYYLDPASTPPLHISEFRIEADNRPYGLFLKGFGEDSDGEIYVCGSSALAPTGTSGVVHRIRVICPGDLNGSGFVDLADLTVQLANFGTTTGADESDGDMDLDGDVDLTDLTLMLSVFGKACP